MGTRRTWVTAGLSIGAVMAATGGVGIVWAATSSTPGCDVSYTVNAEWNTGFTAAVRVRNTSTSAISGWNLSWTFPAGQRVTQGWNGNYTQAGATVTVTPAAWNAAIAPGAAVDTGFNGSHTGSDPRPTGFTLNGVRCTVGGVPTSPTATSPPTTPAPTTSTPTARPTGTPSGTATGAPTPTSTPTGTPTTTSPTPPRTTTPLPTGTGPASGTGRIQYGATYTGEGTFYGATGAGNCSYDAGPDRMIAAMNAADYQNSQACGAYVAVTGPSGSTVTVKIVDQCPECKPGDIDLSAEAFAKLAAPSAGRIKISWQLLSPTLSGPVAYRYKDGSSVYWCGIQVLNHRNPIRSLEVLVAGSWRSLPRQPYNYFVSADGAGCGGNVRVTDIYGHQIVDSGIAVRPGVVQQGRSQFGPAT